MDDYISFYTTQRTIQELVDCETGDTVDANELLDNSREDIKSSIRSALIMAQKSNDYKYVCATCNQPVHLVSRYLYEKGFPIYYFAHFKDSDECPIKTDSKDYNVRENLDYISNRFKTSKLHEDLSESFIKVLNSNSEFSDIFEKPYINNPEIVDGWRKPDVTSMWKFKQLVFEFQIFNTFISTIVDRTSFYKMQRMSLMWIFPFFTTLHQKMCEKDIYYLNKRNVFVFDKKEYYDKEDKTFNKKGEKIWKSDDYKYAYNESIRRGMLVLRCYWQVPKVVDGKVCIEWHNKLVTLDELTFDENTYELYYYNSDKDFYQQSDSKMQKLIDEWEEAKKKRWDKIFNSITVRNNIYSLLQLFAKENDSDKNELIDGILNGKIQPDPFEENGLYGFKIKNIVIVSPKYSAFQNYEDGLALVRVASWGAIDLFGKKVIDFRYLEIKRIAKNLFAAKNKQRYYGIINNKNEVVLSFYYSEIGEFVEGKAKAQKYDIFGGKYGYVDETGKTLIPFEYSEIGEFVEGKAIARKGWDCGYIDETGKILIPFEYSYIGAFVEGKAKARKDGKYGYIDATGKTLIPFEYSEIYEFVEGKAKAQKDGKYGYIDEKGNELIQNSKEIKPGLLLGEKFGKYGIESNGGDIIVPFKYSEIGEFVDGKAKVQKDGEYGYCYIDEDGKELIENSREIKPGLFLGKKFGKYGIESNEGDIIVPFKYSEIGEFVDGKAKVKVQKYGEYGCIDEAGNELVENSIEIKPGLLLGKKFGKYGIESNSGDIIVPFEYSEIYEFVDGKAKARKEGKYGYIDETGKILIPFEYSEIYEFVDGKAKARKDGKYGYIDATGKTLIPFEYSEIYEFVDGKAKARKGDKYGISGHMHRGKYGYMDATGKTLIPFEYSEIYEFVDGKAKARKYDKYDRSGHRHRGKYGFIDETGKILIPFEYSEIGEFVEGKAKAKKDDEYGYIDATGKTLIPFKYSEIGEFVDGKAKAQKDGESGYIDEAGNELIENFQEIKPGFLLGKKYGKYGIESKGGDIIIPFEYSEIGEFVDGKAKAQKDGKSGYIDENGKTLIPFEYSVIGRFVEGKAIARKGWDCGYIDETGKILIPFEYSEIGEFVEGKAIAKKDDEYGYIDATGKTLIPFEYSWIYDFVEGKAKAKKNDKYGYIDETGKILIPFEYSKIGEFVEGKAIAKKNDNYGYIDETGKILIPFEYSEMGGFVDGKAIAVKDGKYGCIDENGLVIKPFIYDSIAFMINHIVTIYKGKIEIEKYPTDAIPVSVYITGINSKIGVFVSLTNVSGLLPISEIRRAGKNIDQYSRGKNVSLYIKNVDISKNRINYSIIPEKEK